MKLGARNQFAGTVTNVLEGTVNGIVSIDVNGVTLTSNISMASIRELGLKAGMKACVVVKATEVMVGLGEHLTLSARNQIPGTVISVEKGDVNSVVKLSAMGDNVVTSIISNGSVEALGLKEGVKALAVIKATSVMVGIE